MQHKRQEEKAAGGGHHCDVTDDDVTAWPVLYIDCPYLRTYFRGDHFKNDPSKKRF